MKLSPLFKPGCLALVAILLQASCNTAPQPAKPRIALVMKSLANEFFKTMQDGATAHRQAHAPEYELIANGIKDELDVARQVEIVEQMIAQQVQAIVIAPADSKALVAKPELKAILCANDSMALGAVAAIRAAGKAGQIRVIGFDNIQAVRQLLKDGQVLATVDQHGDQLAVYGIEYALETLKNKTSPADRETKVDLITAEHTPRHGG